MLPSFVASLKEQFQERVIKVMMLLGVIALLTGFNDGLAWGWVKGVSIFVSVAFLVGIGSLNDYYKDKEFLSLQHDLEEGEVIVFRGKAGSTQTVNIDDLVVGDVIQVENGSKIPADCVLFDSANVSVNEGVY